jgi:adenosylcobinamide-phosphate synthase
MPFLPWHLAAAYLLDLILGDPPRWPHPVRWIGRLILWVESIFYETGAPAGPQRTAGGIFFLVVVSAVLMATALFLSVFHQIHPALGACATIWCAYTTLATKSLTRESARVAQALDLGDLETARQRLSFLVSRNTRDLDEVEIRRALVETVSENLSDGVVAPLFYLALGGPIAAMVYKAVNTMDSMVGYKNDRYLHFGWVAARCDDAANFIPARLTALFMLGAARILGLNWRRGWNILRRDARKSASPNAGYPEAAAAGILGVQLGGPSVYFGERIEKPTLGDPVRTLEAGIIEETNRLALAVSVIAFVLAAAYRIAWTVLW